MKDLRNQIMKWEESIRKANKTNKKIKHFWRQVSKRDVAKLPLVSHRVRSRTISMIYKSCQNQITTNTVF
jgi:hypothetical protein